jgi:signal transduction histidine kinase/ligand-binding sensor domain-containing protein
MMRQLSVFLLSILLIQGLSQTSLFSQIPNSEDYVVTHFGMEEGLPQNSVNDIVQADNGYIWLATFGGLVRFDGHRFRTYNRSNTEGMDYDRVVSIFEDSNNNIWGASEQGVVKLTKDKATSYSIDKRTTSASAGWIKEDKEGRIWGALNGNFYLQKNNQFERQMLFEVDGEKFQKISADTTGAILYMDKIVAKSYKDTLYKILDLREKIESNIISLIEYPENSGVFFIGTSGNGVLKLKDEEVTFLGRDLGLNNKDILGFYEDRKNRLWIYSYEGILINEGSEFQTFRMDGEDQNFDIQIRSMFEDNEGNLWLGSVAEGLFRLKETQISMIDVNDGLINQRMLSLSALNDGSFIFGTNCGGVFVSQNGVAEFPAVNKYLPNNCIWSVFQDSKDRIWFSANGLYMTNSLQEKGKIFGLNDGFEGINIFAIAEDKLGNIWIGCSNGIFKYNDVSGFTTYKTEEGFNFSETRVLHEDANGNIWAGTIAGLYKITDDNVEQVKLAHSKNYPNKTDEPYIRAIYHDEDGTYWFGSYGNGIFRMEEDQIINITSQDGLFDNIVSHIVEDDHGNFWIGSNRGIFRVSRNNLNDFSEGVNDEILSYSYGTGDGMNSAETNGGFHPSTIQDSDGNIYFPTVSGVAVVSTNRIIENDRVPLVYIEQIRSNAFDYSQKNEIEMNYDDSFLEINYTGINFSNPERLQFRYKLEGFNDNWIDVRNQRSAIYSKIPPGDYTFRVTAAANNGVWNDEGASFDIIVTPPFWQKDWFIAIVSGLIFGVGFLFYRIRTNLLREENERQKRFTEQLIESEEYERSRIAAELHDGLGQQMMVIKNRAELAKNFIGDRDTLEEQLNEIMQSAVISISDVRSMSYGLRPVHLERFGLTEAINNLLDQVKETTKIQWDFEIVNVDGLIVKNKEINFYRVLQEAINNILKHSEADKASITIIHTDKEIKISITDNGIGFDAGKKENLVGLGLSGMQERVETLSGKMDIFSSIGEGTQILVSIPKSV